MDSSFNYRYFHVEKIIGVHIGLDNDILYQVQWAPTWEPLANLAGCEKLIKEFWMRKSCRVLGVDALSIKQEESMNLEKSSVSSFCNSEDDAATTEQSVVDLTATNNHLDTPRGDTTSTTTEVNSSKTTKVDPKLNTKSMGCVKTANNTAFKSTSKHRKKEQRPCSISKYVTPLKSNNTTVSISRVSQITSINRTVSTDESSDILFEVCGTPNDISLKENSKVNPTSNDNSEQTENKNCEAESGMLVQNGELLGSQTSGVSHDEGYTPVTLDTVANSENGTEERNESAICPVIINTVKDIEQRFNAMYKEIEERNRNSEAIVIQQSVGNGKNNQQIEKETGNKEAGNQTNNVVKNNVMTSDNGVYDYPTKANCDIGVRNLLKDSSNNSSAVMNKKIDDSTCSRSSSSSSESMYKIIGKRKTKTLLYECIACSLFYKTETSLRRHCRIHHRRVLELGEVDFKCSVCKKQFIRISNLLVHAKTHAEENVDLLPPLSCGLCEEAFETVPDLSSHAVSHEFDLFYINFTRKNASKKTLLKPKSLSCKRCSIDFKSTKEMRKHALNHIKNKIGYKGLSPEKVTDTPKRVITKNTNKISKIEKVKVGKTKAKEQKLRLKKLKKKLKSKSVNIIVKLPKRSYTSDNGLPTEKINRGQQKKPLTNGESSAGKTGGEQQKLKLKSLSEKAAYKKKWYANKNKWECQSCSLRFLNYYQLKKHQKIHNTKVKQSYPTFFTCPLCPKEKPKRGVQMLNLHCLRVHGNEESFPEIKGMLKCPSCVMFFPKKRGLLMHMCKRHDMKAEEAHAIISLCVEGLEASNEGNAKSKCKKLKKTLSTKNTKESQCDNSLDFNCSVSSKSTDNNISTLVVTTEDPETPGRHRCRFCSCNFSNSTFLSRHERSAHKEKNDLENPPIFNPDMFFQYICFLCEKSYPTKANLMGHARKHHATSLNQFQEKFNVKSPRMKLTPKQKLLNDNFETPSASSTSTTALVNENAFPPLQTVVSSPLQTEVPSPLQTEITSPLQTEVSSALPAEVSNANVTALKNVTDRDDETDTVGTIGVKPRQEGIRKYICQFCSRSFSMNMHYARHSNHCSEAKKKLPNIC